VFAALKLSLAFAIQHGFIAVLVFCGAIVLASFFLNDVPMKQQTGELPDEAERCRRAGKIYPAFSDESMNRHDIALLAL
jgi:hypothetical protein